MADAFRFFGLSCPSGGSFYICENNATEFIGCCTTNPCTPEANGHCPTANLRASSFSADTYTDLPRQDCDDAQSIEIWYTCKFNQPPFMGCCASNPCAKGLCIPSDLRPAKLSGQAELKASFLQPGAAATSTATAASSTTSSNGLSSGAIGGIVVGVVVAIILAVVLFLYKRGWRARVDKEKDTPAPIGAGMYYDAVPPGQPSPGFSAKGGEYRGQLTILSSRELFLTARFRIPSERTNILFRASWLAKTRRAISPGLHPIWSPRASLSRQ